MDPSWDRVIKLGFPSKRAQLPDCKVSSLEGKPPLSSTLSDLSGKVIESLF